MRISPLAVAALLSIHPSSAFTSSSSRSSSISIIHTRSTKSALFVQTIPEQRYDHEHNEESVMSSSMRVRRRMKALVSSAAVAVMLPFVCPSTVQAKVPFGWTGESITEGIVKDAQNREMEVRSATDQKHAAVLNKIREEKGEFAARQYDEKFKTRLRLEDAKKSLATAKLKRDLLLKGIQPNSLEFNGYLFDKLYGVNLFEVPGTEYQNVFGEKQKMTDEEIQKERAENIATYKEEIDEAVKIVEISTANVKRMADALGIEVDLGDEADTDSKQPAAIAGSNKETKKQEKIKAKKEAQAIKEKAKAEKKAAKEEDNRLKTEQKAKAKKEKESMKLATKATAAATASAVVGQATVADNIVSQVMEQESAPSIIAETVTETEQQLSSDDSLDADEESVTAIVDKTESTAVTVVESDKKIKIMKSTGASILAGTAAFQGWSMYKKKSEEAEAKRMEQFKLIMGSSEDDEKVDTSEEVSAKYDALFSDTDTDVTSAPAPTIEPETKAEVPPALDTNIEPAVVPEIGKKKRKKGIGGIFAKNDENARETDINNLFEPSAVASTFSKTLAGILTFGAPGRFPDLESLESRPSSFDLESAKETLSQTRESEGLTTVQAAEAFACVVNCMIITITDLASVTLKAKDDKVTVDALNVVLDFMDHAASLYDAVADGVVITPVTYGGTLGVKKLEQMFSKFSGGNLAMFDTSAQDRMDTLQQVFKISDKKAEGLTQKVMMKNLMKLMKDGGGEGMESMEGMPGMEEMMKAMGGAEGLGDLGGLGGLDGMGDGGDINPEELKQTITMMSELMESGQVSKEEMKQIREEFKKANGIDLAELIKTADGMGASELGDDGKELLDLFKKVLGED